MENIVNQLRIALNIVILSSMIALIWSFVKPDDDLTKFRKIAEKGYIYASRLDNEHEVYRLRGVEVVLSEDMTGRRSYLWNKVASNISKNWIDGFGGFKGFSWFKPQIDNLIDNDIPVDTTKLMGYSYQLGKMNMGNSSLSELRFCEKQGWKDMNMLMIVAKHGCFDCVKYMVEDLGASVDHADCSGFTAAMHATKRGHFAVAKYLVERMDSKVKNTQFFYKNNGLSLYDLAPSLDFEDKIDASSSTMRFRYFLWDHGVISGTELHNEIGCFVNFLGEISQEDLKYITERNYPVDGNYVDDKGDIGYCLYLMAQYEDRCIRYTHECDRQKQIATYIKKRGYSLSNWEEEKNYFSILMPSRDKPSQLDLQGGFNFRFKMEELNGKSCDYLFSDCGKKLKWEGRSRR